MSKAARRNIGQVRLTYTVLPACRSAGTLPKLCRCRSWPAGMPASSGSCSTAWTRWDARRLMFCRDLQPTLLLKSSNSSAFPAVVPCLQWEACPPLRPDIEKTLALLLRDRVRHRPIHSVNWHSVSPQTESLPRCCSYHSDITPLPLHAGPVCAPACRVPPDGTSGIFAACNVPTSAAVPGWRARALGTVQHWRDVCRCQAATAPRLGLCCGEWKVC